LQSKSIPKHATLYGHNGAACVIILLSEPEGSHKTRRGCCESFGGTSCLPKLPSQHTRRKRWSVTTERCDMSCRSEHTGEEFPCSIVPLPPMATGRRNPLSSCCWQLMLRFPLQVCVSRVGYIQSVQGHHCDRHWRVPASHKAPRLRIVEPHADIKTYP